MTAALRPMNLGEILDRTFEIYRKRFLVFVRIAALPVLATIAVPLLVTLMEMAGVQSTLPVASRVLLHRVSSWASPPLLMAFFQYLMWPAFVAVASSQFLGEKLTVRAAIAPRLERARSWLALAIVLWSTCDAIPSFLNLSLMEKAVDHFSISHVWLGVLGSARFFEIAGLLLRELAELVLSVALCPSVPAWLIENSPLNVALRRGWAIGKRDSLRISTAWLAAMAIRGALFALVVVAFWWIFSGYGTGAFYQIRLDAFIAAIGAVSALASPLFPIAITLIYYDQRIRHEGYDIVRMMETAGMNTIAALPAETPKPEAQEAEP